MTEAINQWLRSVFAAVPDVSRVSNTPDPSVIFKEHHADMVISTWMGSRLYLYLIPTNPKLRDIKNLLRENGRNSIGTIFIANARLLPEDGTTVKLQDWWEALFLLNDGFIYTYKIAEEGLFLSHVHFTPSNAKDEFRCWHFDEFKVENLSVRKREINLGNIKGTWYIGDMVSASYKRKINSERAQQQFHYRTKYTQEVPYEGRKNVVNGNGREAQLLKYYNLLGVDDKASEQQIKTAFRQMALRVHPDVSALPREVAHEKIKELNEAYDFIKDYHGWV
jgi:DnaJ-domain-containing protein 1